MYDMRLDEYAGTEVGYVESVVLVQDINHIQKFFGYDRTIFNLKLANFQAVIRHDDIEIGYSESDCCWRRLSGYARFVVEHGGEKNESIA